MAKVLHVDDDPAILRAVELALKAIGHEPSKADNPQLALEMMEWVKPDIMIVDVMMPTGTEGFHLVWTIRQLEDEALRNVPIIMATGIHEQTDLRFYPDETDGTYQPGEYLPIQGWLDKPVRVEALGKMISDILSAPAAA